MKSVKCFQGSGCGTWQTLLKQLKFCELCQHVGGVFHPVPRAPSPTGPDKWSRNKGGGVRGSSGKINCRGDGSCSSSTRSRSSDSSSCTVTATPKGGVPPLRSREHPLCLGELVLTDGLAGEDCRGAGFFPRTTERGEMLRHLLVYAL